MGGRPVLFLSYSGVLGGSERVLLDCATRLGRPALVACPEGPLAAAVRQAGLGVAPLPNRSLRMRGARGAALRALGGLSVDAARLARRRRPVLVVAWGARAVLAAAAAPRGGAPVLAVHHDFLPSAGVAAAVRAATALAAGVVATSEAVARDLNATTAPTGGPATTPPRAGVASRGPRPVTVLRPGVDLAAWQPAPAPPPAPPRALVLGALVPWKRPALALEIAARVPELQLTVAGTSLPGDGTAYADGLRRRAAAADLAGRVTFTGALADPRPALAAAHCLLHCADTEPFGMALVEAMAGGRPVVAPAAAGPLEIVAEGTGRLYEPGDAAAGAAALRALLADPGAGAAARRHAERRFDVEASAARFAAAVDEAAR